MRFLSFVPPSYSVVVAGRVSLGPALLALVASLSGCLAGSAPGDSADSGAGASSSAATSAAANGPDGGARGSARSVGLASGTGSPGASAGASSIPASVDAGLSTTSVASSAPADASVRETGSGYQIDLSETSVSGFSSGAFFAVQFHVAFSSTVKGAAIFAGGPYDCAGGSSTAAETTCLTGSPSVPPLVSATKQAFASGTIDDPANLANERVFLFGGADDSVVHPSVMASLDTYYASFMSASSIQFESQHPGTSHTMPTLSYGGSCDSVVSPYVGDCHYDGAGAGLQQIYGTLAAPATTLGGAMLSFPQSKFVPDPASKGLGPIGYYYVPASCAHGETCRIHVSFHGCQQTAASVGDAYYAHAGYNPWADTNHIIVLYPQAASSSGNDYACWDFWGYDGAGYATKSGTQLAAVRAMIGWIAAGGAGVSASQADGGVSSADAGATDASSGCIKASNTAHVAAGRAVALGGFAYAKGSSEPLGADNASTDTSLKEASAGYYTVCL